MTKPSGNRNEGRIARRLLLGTSAAALAVALGTPVATAQATGPIDTGPGTFTGDFVNSGTTPGVFISNQAVVNGNIINPAGATLSPGIPHPGLKSQVNFTDIGIGILGSTLNGRITNAGNITVTSATNGAVLAGIAIHPLITQIVGPSSFIGSPANIAGGIINSGTVFVPAHQGGGALAVYDAASTQGGGFTNTGLIVVTGTAAGAGGVQLDQFNGTPGYIFNGGTISVTGASSGGGFTDVKGTFIGFTNTGVITVSDASGSSAVIGLHLDSSVTLSQGVTNTGVLQVASSGTPNGAPIAAPFVQGIEIIGGGISGPPFFAQVVNFDPTIGGAVLNIGTILATDAAAASGATGIEIFGGVTIQGGVINRGLISATSVGGLFTPNFGSPATSGAFGILISGQANTAISTGLAPVISGGVSNGGVITVSSANGPARGIEIKGPVTISGGISNSGTVIAGTEIFVQSGPRLSGDISNNGLLMGNHAGIQFGGTTTTSLSPASLGGNVVNSGTIATSGNAIHLLGNLSNGGMVTVAGGVTNSGTVTVGANVAAIALNAGVNLTGSVSNSGAITGEDGISVDSLSLFRGNVVHGALSIGGSVANAGTISILGSGLGIVITGATVTGGVFNAGRITGTGGNVGVQIEDTELFKANGNTKATAFNAGPAVIGGITNVGVIALAGNSTGINVLGPTSTINGNISNSGTVMARFGIVVSGGSVKAAINQPGAIVNNGLIASSGTGILVSASGGVRGGIANTGSVTGGNAAIDLSQASAANVINQQAGAIIGAVKLSPFGDTFNISGGTVTGSIVGGQNVQLAGKLNAGSPETAIAFVPQGGAVNLTGGSLVLAPTSSVSGVTAFNATVGGTLVMQVTANTLTHPVVNASTISIGTGSVFEVAPLGGLGSFARKQTYADVVVSGSAFADNFTVTTTTPLAQGSLVADPSTANALDLVLNVSALCVLNGLTFNQHSTGCRVDALGNVATDAASLAFLGDIFNLSLSQLPGALDQLSGSQHPQTNHQTVQDTQTALDIVVNHLAGGGASAPLTGWNFSREGLRFASLDGGSDAPRQTAQAWGGSGSNPFSVWATGYGSFANASDTIDAPGFSASTGGGVAALEYDAGSGLLLGGAFNYAHSAISFNADAGSSGISQYLFLPYGRWSLEDWYASGVGAIGWDDISTNRVIAFPGFGASASSSHGGLSYGVLGESGYNFHCEPGWTVTPVVRLGFAGLSSDAFSESGGPAALTVNSQTSQSLVSAIGGRLTTRWSLGGAGTLTPEVHAFWQHEFLDAQTQVTAAFVGAPTGAFVTLGSNFGRDSGLVGFAISTDAQAPQRFSLSYDAQINGSFTSHTFAAAFHARF